MIKKNIIRNSLISYKTKNLKGSIVPPADKSISHRALLFSSLAIGKSKISNLLKSEMPPTYFDHVAFFNSLNNRIEMHLCARYQVELDSPFLNQRMIIKKGDSIHTENSYKYNEEIIEKLADNSGLTIKNIYHDKKEWFALVHLIKTR